MSSRGWLLLAGVVVVVGLAVGLLFLARPTDHAAPVTRDSPRDAATAPADAALAHASPIDARAPAPRVDAAMALSSEPTEQRAARDERAHLMTNLHESGSAREVWVDQGLAVLQVLARAGADETEAGCFVAGCGATFTFPSEADYRRGVDALIESDAFRAWTGGKRFAPPERRPNGTVVIAIVLYRPD